VFSQLIYLTKSYFECRAGWESLRVARRFCLNRLSRLFIFYYCTYRCRLPYPVRDERWGERKVQPSTRATTTPTAPHARTSVIIFFTDTTNKKKTAIEKHAGNNRGDPTWLSVVVRYLYTRREAVGYIRLICGAVFLSTAILAL
jgi:hypothetical protein